MQGIDVHNDLRGDDEARQQIARDARAHLLWLTELIDHTQGQGDAPPSSIRFICRTIYQAVSAHFPESAFTAYVPRGIDSLRAESS